MMRFFKKYAASLIVALIGLVSFSVHADAVQTNVTFLFGGNCIDCAEAAGTDSFPITGTLVLKGGEYQIGEKISPEWFISFSYGGSNLINPFEIAAGSGVFMSTYSFGSPSLQLTEDNGNGTYRYFYSSWDGTWSTGINDYVLDFGNNATMTNANYIPEPATLLMFSAALAGLGLSRHRRAV